MDPTTNPQPNANPGATPAVPPAPSVPPVPPAPVPPVVNPTNPVATPATPPPASGLDALPLTDPIMRPDLPPAPDPVKQELEAPMRPAAPVPGSIGSAVSVPETKEEEAPAENAEPSEPAAPAAPGSTPNVAFNDPAEKPTTSPDAPAAPDDKDKSKKLPSLDPGKLNKNTIIALAVVGAMIIIALVAVLLMQIMK